MTLDQAGMIQRLMPGRPEPEEIIKIKVVFIYMYTNKYCYKKKINLKKQKSMLLNNLH